MFYFLYTLSNDEHIAIARGGVIQRATEYIAPWMSLPLAIS